MKKLVSLILVLALSLTCAVALAARPSKVTGEVTINSDAITTKEVPADINAAAADILVELYEKDNAEFFGIETVVKDDNTEIDVNDLGIDEFSTVNFDVDANKVGTDNKIEVPFTVQGYDIVGTEVVVFLGKLVDGEIVWTAYVGTVTAEGTVTVPGVDATVLSEANFFAAGAL
jgi:hypothetical protein